MIKGDGDPLAEAFADAGLGVVSCREAARLVRSTGMSFETAAVLGQRLGEKSEATSERIREAASAYRGQRDAVRPRSPWKRWRGAVDASAGARRPAVALGPSPAGGVTSCAGRVAIWC